MSLGDLANLGQIIGAIAVVISLFMSLIRFDKTPTLCGLPRPSPCMNISRSGITSWPRVVTSRRSRPMDCATYASLSEQEKARFIATFMAFLSYSQNAFLKWREGLLTGLLWMGVGSCLS